MNVLPFPSLLIGTPRRPIASCFGGGGAFGIAFEMGVVAGLIDAGVPVDRGPMLGTSAGAWTAAAVATGLRYERLVAATEAVGSVGRVQVIELARAAFGDQRDARVTGMAMQIPMARRRALSGRDHALADIVAASSSLPRYTVPHTIHGRRYVDAGITRNTSVDRVKSARVLVVVAPISGPTFGALGRLQEQITGYEIQQWRLRTGGNVLYVRPTHAIAAIVRGHGLGGILDQELATAAHAPAYDLGVHCAERFRARHPHALDHLATAS
jgi:NTE family protein